MGVPIQYFAVAILGFWSGAALAEGTDSLSTQIETTTGWTSNAGDDSFETESLFARQSGTVTGIVRESDFVLRGSISGTQTQYFDAEFENDRGAELGVTLDYQLTPDTAMRGSIGVALDESGSVLGLGVGGLAVRTLTGRVNADLTLVQTWDQLEVALDLRHTQQRTGESHVADDLFDPERLDPDILIYTAGLRAAYRLDDSKALLGEAGLRHVDIPAEDQAVFGRQPVTALRIAAGGQIGGGGSHLLAKGGADILMETATADNVIVLPFAEIEANWAVSDGFGLTAEASAQTYLRAPTDGIADWTLAASAGAHWLPLDGLVLSASASAEQDFLSDGQTLTQTRRGVRFGANQQFGDSVDAGIHLSLSDTQYAGGAFQTTELGLDLNAVM